MPFGTIFLLVFGKEHFSSLKPYRSEGQVFSAACLPHTYQSHTLGERVTTTWVGFNVWLCLS